jgi:hypothetical protein
MAIAINWLTRRITIPQSDLTPISGVLYQLDVNAFRLQLKDLEDSDDGMGQPDTHRHNTQVVLSGVTYARTLEIINGYTVEFQNTGSPYIVSCVGANHNLADVYIPGSSTVSLIIGNSAGLIVTDTGGGGGASYTPAEIADAVWDEPKTGHSTAGSMGAALDKINDGIKKSSILVPHTEGL